VTTIVVGHFRIPEERLRGFLSWNAQMFNKYNVKINLVTDRHHKDLPVYVNELIYPTSLLVYSPSRVSNYGIRQAGSGKICKSDIDVVFSEQAMQEVCYKVRPGVGYYWNYRMAPSYEERLVKSALWGAGVGTMCLDFSDWDRLNGYDERQEGYGVEDGDGVQRARKIVDLKHSRAIIYHISHNPENELWTETNRCWRRDLWNRDTGFCPDRHKENRAVRDSNVPWSNPNWGNPS